MSIVLDGSQGVTFPNGTNPQAAPSKVLQVVNATYSTQTSNSTSTLADTGLTATITPLFSTSKILICVNQCGLDKDSSNAGNAIDLWILKNGSNLIRLGGYTAYTNSTLRNIVGSLSSSYLDSPATTSALTYKTQFMNVANVASVTVQSQGVTSTITLMEIAA